MLVRKSDLVVHPHILTIHRSFWAHSQNGFYFRRVNGLPDPVEHGNDRAHLETLPTIRKCRLQLQEFECRGRHEMTIA
jgi:hypothetical protein